MDHKKKLAMAQVATFWSFLTSEVFLNYSDIFKDQKVAHYFFKKNKNLLYFLLHKCYYKQLTKKLHFGPF